MKKTVKILSVVLSLSLALSLAGCGKNAVTESEPEPSYDAADISVACLKGPTGVGMTRLMQLAEDKITANNYTFTIAAAPDEIAGKVLTGELNIASVPTNLAAKLYKKSEGKITMLAVNTLSVLSIIENGNSVNTFSDLKGKTIYSTGEGSNPEYILKYLLRKNGLEPDKDVTVKFVTENDELTAAIVSGNAEVALVPEPLATIVLNKKDTLRRAVSISDAWDQVVANGDENDEYTGSKIMMGCVVALKSYVEANRNQVDKFLDEYRESIEYVNENLDDSAALCAKYEIIPADAAVAKSAIVNSNIAYVEGTTMKDSIQGYFKVLFDADPTSIGGSLPDADFYYNVE